MYTAVCTIVVVCNFYCYLQCCVYTKYFPRYLSQYNWKLSVLEEKCYLKVSPFPVSLLLPSSPTGKLRASLIRKYEYIAFMTLKPQIGLPSLS